MKQKIPSSPSELVKSLPQELKNILFSQWKAKQNPKWHPEGNTLKHILVVLRRVYHHFPEDTNLILAALFHDLGKMDTYKVNPKTNEPTAHGHENVSTEYVEKFADWINSFENANIDEIKYLVKNHMKVKPQVWDAMKERKKEKISSNPSFEKLMSFTNKLDGGGTHLKESQNKKIINLNDKLKVLEKVFNDFFIKKYYWFHEIELNDVGFNQNGKYFYMQGKIFVDENWGGNQWMEYHYSTPIPEDDHELSFSDIIGGSLGEELQNDFKTIFSMITGYIPKFTSFSWLDTYLISKEEMLMKEQIQAIKELFGLIKEETEGKDKFINRIIETYPEAENIKEFINSFIINSNCKKIQVSKFSHGASGLALHNGIVFNDNIFYMSFDTFLFIMFHELAHQYQYKKYGEDKMYEFYLGDENIEEAAKTMKSIEMIADEFATRKLRELVGLGFLDKNKIKINSGFYKNIPLSYFKSMILDIKNKLREKEVRDKDTIVDIFYNILKIKTEK